MTHSIDTKTAKQIGNHLATLMKRIDKVKTELDPVQLEKFCTSARRKHIEAALKLLDATQGELRAAVIADVT